MHLKPCCKMLTKSTLCYALHSVYSFSNARISSHFEGQDQVFSKSPQKGLKHLCFIVFRDLSNRGLDNPDSHLYVYCAAERLIIKILCLFVSVEKIWTHTHTKVYFCTHLHSMSLKVAKLSFLFSDYYFKGQE